MMRKLGFILGLFWLCVPIAARGVTCEPGYYPKDGECTICPEHYACPDGVTHYICNDIQYTDGPGATECQTCPKTVTITDGFKRFWVWRGSPGIHACRAEWEIRTAHGKIIFSCSYFGDGYDTDTIESDGKCMVHFPSCDAGYYYDPYFAYKIDIGGATHWTNSYQSAKTDPCQSVGLGRYSPAANIYVYRCPDGTSTHTDTAESADECLPLCAGGATQLHAGEYKFNLWATKYTSPALNVRMPGGEICYVSLQDGHTTGGLNIRHNGTIYHATN